MPCVTMSRPCRRRARARGATAEGALLAACALLEPGGTECTRAPAQEPAPEAAPAETARADQLRLFEAPASVVFPGSGRDSRLHFLPWLDGSAAVLISSRSSLYMLDPAFRLEEVFRMPEEDLRILDFAVLPAGDEGRQVLFLCEQDEGDGCALLAFDAAGRERWRRDLAQLAGAVLALVHGADGASGVAVGGDDLRIFDPQGQLTAVKSLAGRLSAMRTHPSAPGTLLAIGTSSQLIELQSERAPEVLVVEDGDPDQADWRVAYPSDAALYRDEGGMLQAFLGGLSRTSEPCVSTAWLNPRWGWSARCSSNVTSVAVLEGPEGVEAFFAGTEDNWFRAFDRRGQCVWEWSLEEIADAGRWGRGWRNSGVACLGAGRLPDGRLAFIGRGARQLLVFRLRSR